MNALSLRLFGLALILGLLQLACVMPLRTTATATFIPLPVDTQTETPEPVIPTDTPLPTSTETVAETLTPTATETVLYTAAFTFSPTETDKPGVEVIIRNNTSYNINLYRHGLSGEIHFLGWLVPTYYGIFRFPSLGEWKIRYCERANDGSDINCQSKIIDFKEESKEYAVP